MILRGDDNVFATFGELRDIAAITGDDDNVFAVPGVEDALNFALLAVISKHSP